MSSGFGARRESQPKGKQRAPGVKTACDRCRKRKVKCAGTIPCSRCVKDGFLCRVTLSDRLRIDNQALLAWSGSTPESSTPRELSFQNASWENTTQSFLQQQFEQSQNKDKRLLEGQACLHLDPSGQIVLSGRSSGFPLVELLGGLSGYSINGMADLEPAIDISASNVYQVNSSSTMPDEEGDGQDPLSSSDKNANLLGSLEPGRSQITLSDIWHMVTAVAPPAQLESLLRHHFSATASTWPILHRSSFLAIYVEVSTTEKCSTQFATLLLSICAIASLSYDHVDTGEDLRLAGIKYYKVARLISRLCRNRLNLYHIQALYLQAIFAEGLGRSSDLAALLSEALALAVRTGMHRVSSSWLFDHILSESRARTWWALYSLEISTAAMFGRMPWIRQSECDASLPVTVQDHFLSADMVDLNGGQPDMVLQASVLEAQAFPILEEIVVAVNAPSQQANPYPPDSFMAEFRRQGPKAPRRSNLLSSLSERLDRWLEMIPETFNVMPNALHTLGSLSILDTVRFTQSLKLRVAYTYIKAFIARETLTIHLEAVGDDDSMHSAAVESSCQDLQDQCISLVSFYSLLNDRGLLQANCGFIHVLHLAFCGRGLLCVADLFPDTLAAKAISTVEIICTILRQSSRRWISALKAEELLRDLAADFEVPLIDIVSSDPNFDVPWVRMVPRRAAGFSSSTGSSPNQVFQ